MSFKRNIREYFTYSTVEKRGLLVLVILAVLAFVVPCFLPDKTPSPIDRVAQQEIDSLLKQAERKHKKQFELHKFNPNTATEKQLLALGLKPFQVKNIINYRLKGGQFRRKSDFGKIYGITSEDYKRYKNYIAIPKKKAKQKKRSPITAKKKTQKKAILFQFNPNTLSLAGWDSLGVSKKIALRIQKYLSKGGKFRKPDDLAKIYGFNVEKFRTLKPYIVLPKKEVKPITLILLNTADTTMLKTINGIGSKLSARIVAYRTKLGGFVNKEQLKEIYGITAKRFQQIAPRLEVDTTHISIKKIDINSAKISQLQKHPYISRRMAQDIVRYRKRKGNFNSVEDLKTKHLVTAEVYDKVYPYLECKNRKE